MARALAFGRGARRRDARGCDPRVAGARVQPPRRQPAPSGPPNRRRGLAARPDRASRSGSVHRRRRRTVRLRSPGASRRCERAACSRPDRRLVRAGFGACADGSRRHGLSRPHPALRQLPARRTVPSTRSALRAAPQAGPVRRLVPPATCSKRYASSPTSLANASSWTRKPSPRWRPTGSFRFEAGSSALPR